MRGSQSNTTAAEAKPWMDLSDSNGRDDDKLDLV